MDRFIAAVVLMAGLVLASAAVFAWCDVARLSERGVTASAIVLAKRQEASGKGGPSYYVAYALAATFPDGRTVVLHEERQVAKERFDQAAIGGSIPVRYLPSDPTINEVVGSDGGATGMSVLAGILVLAGLTIWFDERGKPRRRVEPMPRLFPRRRSRISTESLRRLTREQRWHDRRWR